MPGGLLTALGRSVQVCHPRLHFRPRPVAIDHHAIMDEYHEYFTKYTSLIPP